MPSNCETVIKPDPEKNRMSWDELQTLTEERFAHPRPGYAFNEMYSDWVFVIEVSAHLVVWIRFQGPGQLPRDGKVCVATPNKFRETFSYKSDKKIGSGYVMVTVEEPYNVKGWADARRSDIDAAIDGKESP